jgi:uncharacterized protein YjbJ (UPF0337 family)
MGDRMQRVKGKADELVGKAKMSAGRKTGSRETEAKGAAQTAKGKTESTIGEAQGEAKKATR